MTPVELNTIASNVAKLSNLFTRERETLPVSYLKDNALRKAYILYFMPSNIYKIHIPLKELSFHPEGILSKKRLRILDLGSGPGTVILGVLNFFGMIDERASLEFTAVDPIIENLKDAERLFKSFVEKASVEASLLTFKSNIEKTKSLPKGPFDIIILSNLLSEVASHDSKRILKRTGMLKTLMKEFLSNDGCVIIIEPALCSTSREMLMVRDGLLKEGFHVYSPCLMNEPCPALINQKDWCHEDIPWEPPALIKEVDKLTGLRKDSLKFSYLVMRKDKLSIRDIYGSKSFRVVSEPLISKGKTEFYVCGVGGRRLVVRLDKNKTLLNESFHKFQRGEIVSLQNITDEGKRLRVGKDTVASLRRHSDGRGI